MLKPLHKRFSRRDFLKVAALGGVSMTAACQAAPRPAAPVATTAPVAGSAATEVPVAASSAKNIEVWSGWTEDFANNIQTILDKYNEAQTQYVAKHVSIADSMNQKLLAAVSAGNPPATAIVFGAGTAYQLAAQNALLPLDDVLGPQLSALKSFMLPSLWDLGTYQGKLYFASMWNQCWGVYVNSDMATKAGLDPTKPPATLEELGAAWDKMTTLNAQGNIDVLGGDLTDNNVLIGRFLGELVSSDGKTITANAPNNVKALEWITERWTRIGPQKLQDFYASLQGRSERSAGQDPFLSGLRASVVTGPWQFDVIRKYKPENFKFEVWPLPAPAGMKKGTYTYGDGWIVPTASPAPDAAADILATMIGTAGNRDVYTNLFTVWPCVNGPVSKEIVDYPAFKEKVSSQCPGYQDIFLADLFNSDQYLYPAKIPTSASYNDINSAEWEKARLGQKTPKEALDFATKTAQTELDNWYKQNPNN